MRSNAPSAAATGVASSSAHLPTQSFSLSPATVTTHASGACAPSSSDAPSGRGTRTIRAGGRPVSAKSAPASGAAPPSAALLACARGTGGARGQSGQGNRRWARSGSSWRGRRTIVAEKPPTSRFFSRPTSARENRLNERGSERRCVTLLNFALRSNFITPLPLLLLHPARLTIASHTIFLRTLKRGCIK